MADPLSVSSVGIQSDLQPSKAFVGSVDLNVIDREMDGFWAVGGFTRLTLGHRLASGTWTTGRVQVLGTLDKINFDTLATLTAVGRTTRIDISDYPFIQIRTTALENAVGVVNFHGYAHSPSFTEVAATPATTLMMPLGIYGNALTTVTSLSDSVTYFQFIGTAPSALTTGDIIARVTTATSGATWAEIGVFSGVFVPRTAASLTRRGFTDVLSIYNSTGLKRTAVALSGISQGDPIWIAFGGSNGINFQLRGLLADDIQSGVFQSFAGRLSQLTSPVTATIESITEVPAWIGLAA